MSHETELFDRKALVVAVWEKFIDLAIINPPPDQDEATDVLQVDAPTLTDAEGDAFFVMVAQVYQDLGITAQNTYIALRNEVDQAGKTASVLVFDVIAEHVMVQPETAPLATGLDSEAVDVEILQIPTDITTIETQRDLETDEVLIQAYNDGIETKNRRKDFLNSLKVGAL